MDNVWVNGIVYRLNHKHKTATIVKVEEVYPVIVIPDKVMTNYAEYAVIGIESAVFYKMDLQQIYLPPTMKKIGNNAFCGCTKLEKIMCDNVECVQIGQLAFTGCHSLMVVQFSGEVSVAKNCFYNCRNIRQIILRAIGKIEGSTFNSCKNLHEIHFTSPKQLIIEPNAILGCENLEEIKIHGSVIDNAGILDLAYEGISVSVGI